MHNRITLNTNNNLLYISLTEIETSFKSNMHSHPNLEILLFVDGTGYIQSTNETIYVKKNDIVIINENCNHVEITKGLRFYAIGIKSTSMFLKETFAKQIINFKLNDQDYNIMLALYNLIYQENLDKHEYSLQITSNTIDSILLLLAKKYSLLIKEITGKENESDLIHSIKQIIDNYYYQDLKLDDIANRLSQSKSTICHEFKKNTGISIIQYKIQKQIEEAKNLLLMSDMNISQIASLVGFGSASYFTKIFKTTYKMTPKEFKNTGGKLAWKQNGYGIIKK